MGQAARQTIASTDFARSGIDVTDHPAPGSRLGRSVIDDSNEPGCAR